MRSISFDSHDGTFSGKIMVYVYDTSHLDKLISNLLKVSGVTAVERMTNEEAEIIKEQL